MFFRSISLGARSLAEGLCAEPASTPTFSAMQARRAASASPCNTGFRIQPILSHFLGLSGLT
ncbi:hypothetical protein CKA32_005505 [Geitlerinema sp. FC II]|nr:hypothetical protein CKA32_005505 [Geitlerinema sp. FC II]